MKKIISIVAMVIISILVGTVIALTFIPKNLNIGLENPSYFAVWKEGENAGISVFQDDEDGVYNEILNHYNASFKTSLLNALFQGKLTAGVNIIDNYKSLTLSDIVKSGSIYLEFRYDTVQTLKLNGQEYTGSSHSDTNYTSVIVEVFDSTSLTQINGYVRYKEEGVNEYSYFRLVSFAAQHNLYNYLQNI